MILVKVGGSLKGAGEILDELAAFPRSLVLVHGGGPEIGAWLARLGYESRFVEGLRVTPPAELEVVEMVLSALGKRLAYGLSQRGRPAVALSGLDAALLKGEALGGLGRVGRITEVQTRLLLDLLEKGYTPLVAPIAWDEEGALNVNADTAAGEIAGALGIPVLFLTDVEGVFKDPKTRLPELTPSQAQELMEKGVIQGGMIPKVKAALAALEAGAPWAVIAKGRRGILQDAQRGTAGTRFRPNSKRPA